MCVALYAFAANRTVTIPLEDGKIELSNGSPVQVNYDVTCFDGSGGSTVFSGLSLAARDSTNFSFGGSTACLSGTTMTFGGSFLNGMGFCNASTNYANIGSVCPVGYHACTATEFKNSFASPFTPPCCGTAWFDSNAEYTGAWIYSTDGGTTFTNISAAFRPSYATNQPLQVCNSGTSTSSVNPSLNIPNCTFQSTGSTGGAFCCPDFLSKTCEVEILNTTPQDGYLQSPQFKGGSPF